MTFGERIKGVLVLSPRVFEEIEADANATGQALGVVVLGSLAAGIGGGLLLGPGALARETLGAIVGWIMWAALTYLLGTRVMPEPQTRTNMGELLRVIGFSSAPNFFSLFALVPLIGWIVRSLVAFWLLAAMVIGVRQALDYRSTPRAIVVVVIGWLIFVLIQWAL
jgi:hypothetical protein